MITIDTREEPRVGTCPKCFHMGQLVESGICVLCDEHENASARIILRTLALVSVVAIIVTVWALWA